jgi:uncharacterized membrane protein (DUF2068 family)
MFTMANSTNSSDTSSATAGHKQTGLGTWLIVIYKSISGLVSIFVGIVFLGLVDEDLTAIGEEIGSKLGLNPDNPLISAFADFVSQISPQQLAVLAVISFVLGTLSITGAIGMALGKDWGDILVIITVSIFLPIAIAGLITSFDIITLILLLVDLTILSYLVVRLRRKRSITQAA